MRDTTHPTEHIQECLKERGWKQADLARALGVHTGRVSEVMKATRRISPEMAIKFEEALGIEAYVLLGIQTDWELAEARKRLNRGKNGRAKRKATA